jgi:hypothetical protein
VEDIWSRDKEDPDAKEWEKWFDQLKKGPDLSSIHEDRYTVEELEDGSAIILTPKEKHTHTFIFLHSFGMNGLAVKEFFFDDKCCKLPDSCKIILPTASLERRFNDFPDEHVLSWMK